MAIKNTLLGGTDWVGKEHFKTEDLNDTFNALTEKIQTLTTFWLNDFLYDVYDDFESYDVGAFVSNDKWDVSTTQEGGSLNCNIQASTINDTGKELYFNTDTWSGSTTYTNTVTVTSQLIQPNKHIFLKFATEVQAYSTTSAATVIGLKIKFGSQSFLNSFSLGAKDMNKTSKIYNTFFVVALGNNKYDVYLGSKKVFSDIEEITPQITLEISTFNTSATGRRAWAYIDDIYQSKHEVN